ncbi:MAG: hypothetical protein WCW31_02520 [Patescibacteria group bacterium]
MMDIIRKEEDFCIKGCRYVGLRPTKVFKEKVGVYALTMEGGAFKHREERSVRHHDPMVKIMLFMDNGQPGGFVKAYVEMEDHFNPELIPPIAITSDMIIHSLPTYSMVLAMLAGPSAMLTITLIEDDKVRFDLAIGTYQSKGVVPLEKISCFLERKPS